MKAFIAIQSYNAACENGMNQALRDTWLKDLPDWCSYAFFVGSPRVKLKMDECPTEAKDDYWDYYANFRASMQYAATVGYDFVFTCDRDTYARPERFKDTRFEHHDYVGYPLTYHECPAVYASFGAGCWFSRKAVNILAHSERRHLHSDASAGWNLQDQGISLWHDPRYFVFRIPVTKQNGLASVHLSTATQVYDLKWMLEVHQEWETS